ncbi:hypothetical protein Gotri_016296 [Gossypium trilobum]|uniref:Mitochondrial arginine transporter BAC2-like n=1 Tax=Gossypium trilobum TaxID=34281 RepID=A0A7J9E323_9ROSI|nr:hypothetical protein [Gossypium trilobum]
MDFWQDLLASNWGREFVAGGFGGIAGTIAGHPLDTLRIRQQSSNTGSAFSILRQVVIKEGPAALYKGMGAPLASVTFQNALVFQIYAILSRAFDSSIFANTDSVPSYKGVAMAGVGTGAIQSLIVSPVELIKIRLQLSKKTSPTGSIHVAKTILKTEGIRGLFRGFNITILRDAPAHGIYFWTYEYMREQLHPGCRKTGDESLKTMWISGGLAGVSSWIGCYPLDVVKTRLQAQSWASSRKGYDGVIDCVEKSVKQEGHGVLWRGLRTTLARAFVVNGAIFAAYETAMRCLINQQRKQHSDRSS